MTKNKQQYKNTNVWGKKLKNNSQVYRFSALRSRITFLQKFAKPNEAYQD